MHDDERNWSPKFSSPFNNGYFRVILLDNECEIFVCNFGGHQEFLAVYYVVRFSEIFREDRTEIFSENRNINVEVLQIGSKDKVCEMSSGKDHVLLLSVAGEVYSFGTGSRGELGHGSLQNESFPVLLDSLQPLRIVQISCGSWYSVALTDGGDVYVWGWNRCGQFGNADPCVIDTPYPLDLEDAFKSILAFRDGLILKKMDGALVVFGSFEFSCQ
ncbi:unnamed protein product [Enterobius vermicularis]|uniref:RCC1 domain-containing protein n=1 Tax=Enterobius vermicularis TaxID=51028 RepID=A0A3P6IWZ2_ENTVE|nr:unnamed protein product [Enterobius vermicularis]